MREVIFMFFGTDLAMERRRIVGEMDGIFHREYAVGDASVSEIRIESDEAAEKLGKSRGSFLTVSVPDMTEDIEVFEGRSRAAADCLLSLLPKKGSVMVAGLGNEEITSDALGPKCIARIFATGHIPEEQARQLGLAGLRTVYAVAPGVAGQTGIEGAQFLKSLCKTLSVSALIAVDALAARDMARLGNTVQITDTGISPGSGVGNPRKEYTRESIGVPVIAVGVPTVIHILHAAAGIFAQEITEESEIRAKNYREAVVTVRDADALIRHAANLTAMAINLALHPSLSAAELSHLTAR